MRYNRALNHPARASLDVASSLAPSPTRRTDVSARSRRSRGRAVRLPLWYSGVVRPLLRLARSPSEGSAAQADAAALPMLQQLPAARSHHSGRVRAAEDEEMIEYRGASVAVPLMA